MLSAGAGGPRWPLDFRPGHRRDLGETGVQCVDDRLDIRIEGHANCRPVGSGAKSNPRTVGPIRNGRICCSVGATRPAPSWI